MSYYADRLRDLADWAERNGLDQHEVLSIGLESLTGKPQAHLTYQAVRRIASGCPVRISPDSNPVVYIDGVKVVFVPEESFEVTL